MKIETEKQFIVVHSKCSDAAALGKGGIEGVFYEPLPSEHRFVGKKCSLCWSRFKKGDVVCCIDSINAAKPPTSLLS